MRARASAREARAGRKVAAGLVLLALGLVGCTSGHGRAGSGDRTDVRGQPSSAASAPSLQALRHAADLRPCPATSSTTAAITTGSPAESSEQGRLPELALPCLGGGQHVRLAALRGSPTLVNVWATWCGPCQREVPYLQNVYAASGGRLRVLGVDTEDSRASALDFAQHAGMRYPSVVDQQGRVLRSTGAPGPPVTLFVAASGKVEHTKIGPFTSERDLRQAVQTYLGVDLGDDRTGAAPGNVS
jgi:thiol-disulfide isomerase/thioredoxin